MATRGIYGFYKNGVNKLTYNHYDSYPSCLGDKVLYFLKNTTELELNDIFNNIVLVEGNDYPDEKESEILKSLGFPVEYHGEPLNWNEIIGCNSHDFSLLKTKFPFMINDNNFIKESLFCEWGYIINLDDNSLEIYEGFQKEPDDNRYKIEVPSKSGYYHCKLLKKIYFKNLSKINSLESILNTE